MIKSVLLNSINTPFGLGIIFVSALAFFIIIWLSLRKLILRLNFLQKPAIRHTAQVLSSIIIGALAYVKQDSSGKAANFFNQIIPEFLHTPLLIFFMFSLMITVLPKKKDPTQYSDIPHKNTI